LAAFGSFTGGHDEIFLVQQGGSTFEVLKNQVGWRQIVDAVYCLSFTWIWGGTSSLSHPVPYFYLPILALILILICAYFRAEGRNGLGHLFFWVSIPVLGGLFQQELVAIGLVGDPVIPGWYLHVLAPMLAEVLALGWLYFGGNLLGRIIVNILILYAVLFFLASEWGLATLYAGCSDIDQAKRIVFSDQTYCLGSFMDIWRKNSLLSYPFFATVCFITGFLVFAIGLTKLPYKCNQ
jgi:hypothetical protein